MRFPGRRGRADQVDFHLHPLTFAETVQIKGLTVKEMSKETNVDKLYKLFYDYLKHGGYLTAINDMARFGSILPATLRTTLRTYSDWIRGDVINAIIQLTTSKQRAKLILRTLINSAFGRLK